MALIVMIKYDFIVVFINKKNRKTCRKGTNAQRKEKIFVKLSVLESLWQKNVTKFLIHHYFLSSFSS